MGFESVEFFFIEEFIVSEFFQVIALKNLFKGKFVSLSCDCFKWRMQICFERDIKRFFVERQYWLVDPVLRIFVSQNPNAIKQISAFDWFYCLIKFNKNYHYSYLNQRQRSEVKLFGYFTNFWWIFTSIFLDRQKRGAHTKKLLFLDHWCWQFF